MSSLRVLFVSESSALSAQLIAHNVIDSLANLHDVVEFLQISMSKTEPLLADIVKYEPQVLHFSAHGITQPLPTNITEKGDIIEITNTVLAEITRGVECVVLHAAQSGFQLGNISQHVPFVIMIPGRWNDRETIAFSSAFYEALGFGKDIESAFKLAEMSILLETPDECDLPILVTQDKKQTKTVSEEQVGIIGDHVVIHSGIDFGRPGQFAQAQIDSIAGRDVWINKRTAYAIAAIIDSESGYILRLRRPYTLQTGIRLSIPKEFHGAEITLSEDKDRFDLEIAVHAEDIDITPNWIQSYTFIRDEESPLIEFTLTSTTPGTKYIRVEYYYERHWLAKIEFEVEVVEA